MLSKLPAASGKQIAGQIWDAVANTPSLSDADLRDPFVQRAIRSSLAAAGGAHWTDLERRIRMLLNRPPWSVVVRGLPADESGGVAVALSAGLGEALEPLGEPWAHVVRRVQATSARRLALDEQLHTDSTDWPRPNAWTVLQCIRPDPGRGGISRVIDGASVVTQVLDQRGPQALELVRGTPIPWAIADALGGGTHYEPVLGTWIRWMPHTVHRAAERNGAALDPSAATVLEIVTDAVQATQAREVLLSIGDVLIVDNRRTLHGRTPLTGSDRLLVRTKVSPARQPTRDRLDCATD
jgi:hypothetical protein